MDKKDPSVGTGLVGAPACGDVMKLQMKVGPDGIVEEAVFKVRTRTAGCECRFPGSWSLLDPPLMLPADLRLRLSHRELVLRNRVAEG